MLISKMTFSGESAFKEIFAGEYALHQAVWDLFADSPDRRRDFIYRMECVGKLPLVYAVSSRVPRDLKGLWHIETKEYAPSIESGIKIGFNVRVNPTVKREGKRHDVVMDAKYQARGKNVGENAALQDLVAESCEKWLNKRSQENGFNMAKFRADGYRQIWFDKAKSGATVRFSTVDLSGVLEVVDVKIFTEMLFYGLGPEKGFGCGLMLVRKL
ncbi:MAG: type I-E CRISPR-associated protein Cas6/Cse3/CasE [Candidatus Omnitrophica bacterium]|nr:type I-E CRISPR-associated protein Cas6/Cse3/CasE [Candidatus Omnitrophota bacterium]